MHAFNILERVNRGLQLLDGQILWHRALENNAANTRIDIQGEDGSAKVIDGNIGWKLFFLEGNAPFVRGASLVAYIKIDRVVFANSDRNQSRRPPIFLELSCIGRDSRQNARRNRTSVYVFAAHLGHPVVYA